MPIDKQELLQWAETQQKKNGVLHELSNKFTSWSSTVTGSPQYWWRQTGKLRAFVDHMFSHGDASPLFFHTGSAAEYYWRPLHRLLQKFFKLNSLPEYEEACGYLARGELVPQHLKHSVHKAIIHTPQVINHYFTLRTESWFNIVLKDVYGIDEFWYRYEFAKNRGQIHYHSLLFNMLKGKELHAWLDPCLRSKTMDDLKKAEATAALNFEKHLIEEFGKDINGSHPATLPRKNTKETDYSTARKNVQKQNTNPKYRAKYFRGENDTTDVNGDFGNIDHWLKPFGFLEKATDDALTREDYQIFYVPTPPRILDPVQEKKRLKVISQLRFEISQSFDQTMFNKSREDSLKSWKMDNLSPGLHHLKFKQNSFSNYYDPSGALQRSRTKLSMSSRKGMSIEEGGPFNDFAMSLDMLSVDACANQHHSTSAATPSGSMNYQDVPLYVEDVSMDGTSPLSQTSPSNEASSDSHHPPSINTSPDCLGASLAHILDGVEQSGSPSSAAFDFLPNGQSEQAHTGTDGQDQLKVSPVRTNDNQRQTKTPPSGNCALASRMNGTKDDSHIQNSFMDVFKGPMESIGQSIHDHEFEIPVHGTPRRRHQMISHVQDLIELVNRAFIHGCSDYCLQLKKLQKEDKWICRFQYGSITVSDRKRRRTKYVSCGGRPCHIVPIIMSSGGSSKYWGRRDCPNVVPHAQNLCSGWRAN